MKITSIKQQVRDSGRASIFVEGKYSFSLSIDELVAEGLKIGQLLHVSDLERLKKLSSDGKLKARALEWVLSRPRSRKEFRDYMLRKGVNSDLVGKAQAEFETKGYLDDAKFASWLVDYRRRTGKSERYISSELASKGVSQNIIQSALTQSQQGATEIARITMLVAKKTKQPKYAQDKNKLVEYLARKGFKYDDIKTALHQIEGD